METLRDIFATIGAIVATLTGLVTLYAKYLDLKKRAARADEVESEPPTDRKPPTHRARPDLFEEPPLIPRRPPPLPPDFAQVLQMVKPPAMALMAAGGLSLLFNLAVIGYMFVDEFVIPLDPQTRERHMLAAFANQVDPAGQVGALAIAETERASIVLSIVMLLSFSVASAAALWAGYNMLRLRSYWLSVAGSFAVMPGACFCCLAGLPIGIWSLVVLLKPEVSEAFH